MAIVVHESRESAIAREEHELQWVLDEFRVDLQWATDE